MGPHDARNGRDRPAQVTPARRRTPSVLGVDGCPGGWIGALVTGRRVRWLLLPDAAAVLAVGADAVGIDIPIGLPDGPVRRGADLRARHLLGSARSSVFFAPPRATLGSPTHADATARSRAAGSTGVSIQTFNILGKIADVDAVMTPDLQRHVVEVHPELSFRRMAGRVDMGSKRTPAGRASRLAAVRSWVDVDLSAAPRPARADDALDALACAWSAQRWLRGAATVVPSDDPPRDARGLRMEIVT